MDDGTLELHESVSKKVKGISKCAVRKQLSLGQFKDCIENSTEPKVSMIGFRSIDHRIFTEVMTKRAINGLDTKRFAVDNVRTLAFGHKDISKLYNID
jgi:hypothetical protein